MHDARVLVVDDSAAMRALFADILDQTKGVTVVGTARDAADARDQLDELRPNVLTLDVEMPGMSGIEFLEEIMATRPMPVVMLSSLTQSGAETSLKAFELGAVDCFPKPLKATPEQFSKTVGKLGKTWDFGADIQRCCDLGMGGKGPNCDLLTVAANAAKLRHASQ